MKKRLLLILAIGISFAPAVFADGIGPFNQSRQASVAGASACSAGMHEKMYAENAGTGSKDNGGSGSTQAGVAN